MFWSENILRFGLPLHFGFELIAKPKSSNMTDKSVENRRREKATLSTESENERERHKNAEV